MQTLMIVSQILMLVFLVLIFIEDYCLGLGIDGNIVNSCFSETSQKCFKLNNEAIIELHDSLINKKCEIGKNSVRSYFGFPLAILKLMQILHETLKP